MKKITFCFCLFFSYLSSNSQGLEKIIVEKYYVSDANDQKYSIIDGNLPVGSVTYRIYVDMLPDYKFQAAYGLPNHELKIATTTKFYNFLDYGDIIPNVIPKSKFKQSTIMLDSWLSVGAASEIDFGILKTEDDGVETVVNMNNPKLLQNADPKAGIPLKTQDGLLTGEPQRVTIFGIDSAVKIFDKDVNGALFSSTNGSWACLVGAKGPTLENKVLIAQMTTDGKFSFELNIQIGKPDGGVENYVARNPVNQEIKLPSLIYPLVIEKKVKKSNVK